MRLFKNSATIKKWQLSHPRLIDFEKEAFHFDRFYSKHVWLRNYKSLIFNARIVIKHVNLLIGIVLA
jgi:hypothetical protein